jgi:hypothetical protein
MTIAKGSIWGPLAQIHDTSQQLANERTHEQEINACRCQAPRAKEHAVKS